MAKVLTLGKGKNKRKWLLTDEEFEEFEFRFEEKELIDLAAWGLDVKLAETAPPPRTK